MTNEKTQVASAKSAFYPTFFLCLFLGGFGAHRFYTGKIKSGLLQLVTLGGCGIWPLVDLIVILLGKFEDKSGVKIPNANPKLTWPIFALALGGIFSPIVLSLAAGNGLLGKNLADSIAKANAETAAEAKAVKAKEAADAEAKAAKANEASKKKEFTLIGTWTGNYADERGRDMMKISEENHIVESYYSREPNVSITGSWSFDKKQASCQLVGRSETKHSY
jgi:TM2 domain-containing membrane protein YozV